MCRFELAAYFIRLQSYSTSQLIRKPLATDVIFVAELQLGDEERSLREKSNSLESAAPGNLDTIASAKP
jgi:hypothetical protein